MIQPASEPPDPQRLSVRRGLRRDDVLHENVPAHLRIPLKTWARAHLGYDRYTTYDEWWRQQALQTLAVKCQIPVPDEGLYLDTLIALADEQYGTDDYFLDVIDMHLQQNGMGPDALETILSGGRSAWTVAESGNRLERRIPDEERHAYEKATSSADSPSDLLRQAWAKTYGRHRDPTGAWADAVKAVEVLMKPIVVPKDEVATLGKMIPALVDAPQKWVVTLLRPKKVAPLDALIDMLRLIYPNPGRHDENQATQTEAEHAVSIAVTLVCLLHDGVLRRTDATGS